MTASAAAGRQTGHERTEHSRVDGARRISARESPGNNGVVRSQRSARHRKYIVYEGEDNVPLTDRIKHDAPIREPRPQVLDAVSGRTL